MLFRSRNDELLAILRRAAEHRALRVENTSLRQEIRRRDRASNHAPIGANRKWLDALRIVDGLVKDLIAALPAGTSFYLSADHGMINSDEYCILGQENSLMEDISLVGGEPRARHLYVRDGSAHDVAARYSDYLGDRVDVFVKSDAQSLFGIATEHAIERMGDVVVVPHGSLLLVDPDRVKQECAMIGHQDRKSTRLNSSHT